MNIFALDPCPIKSARMLCDKHVVKMPLETAQILCTILDSFGIAARYKPTHKFHPCTIWAKASSANFDWLAVHGWALCNEYKMRYGKDHKCLEVIHDCLANKPRFEALELTPFALAMPDEYKTACPHESYLNYYQGAKSHLFKYTFRKNPFE